ncbi:hypothetical protein ACIOHS_42120 [Streptomyces sp. NPDC088253]|uniref:hypothetical protein n=1 Tax=Streptomyces sp. NPDC088253 TaxID=3365846 RepID=UPI00380E98DC
MTGLGTVALARGAGEAVFAEQRGAHHYIHSTSGTPLGDAHTQDTMAFSALRGTRPTAETMPLDRTEEAYR